MFKLKEKYIFDWHRIFAKDNYHIEYSITDICNKKCKACSHLAPLAKNSNFVTEDEFIRVVKHMKKLVPDAHTFWLTGGEPTLHPDYIKFLQILREIFNNTYIGIYSNGLTLLNKENDNKFWDFIRFNGIVWAITNYDTPKEYFEKLFFNHGCENNLAIIQNGKTFAKLTNYSFGQPINISKYIKCGWERIKINIRNGKIYNCAASEFVDLFNDFYKENLILTDKDYLIINERLTREQIDNFRNPMPFCGQCDIRTRYIDVFPNEPSKYQKCEWSNLN